MAKSREELMQEAEKINVKSFTIPDAITELLEYGKRGENVKANLNGKWYYSLQTEDEMYNVFCGKTKVEYIEAKKKDEELSKAMREKEEAAKMREKIKEENLPVWKEELKQYYSKEGYERVFDDIEYLLNDDYYSSFELKNLVRDVQTTIDILKAAKEGKVKEAHQMYLAIANSHDARIKNTAASNIYHSYYLEEMEPVVAQDWAEWYGYDEKKVNKTLKEIREQAKKKKAEGLLVSQRQPGDNQ